MIFARKIYKIPEFYMIFVRTMPEFYIIIARKIFFSWILGGHVPPLPPSPTPTMMPLYAYQFCRQRSCCMEHLIPAELRLDMSLSAFRKRLKTFLNSDNINMQHLTWRTCCTYSNLRHINDINTMVVTMVTISTMVVKDPTTHQTHRK